MSQIIDKECATVLPLQIRNLLAARIESGHYQPGRKMDSIRRLAGELDVSPVTVIEALKMLEKENYIVRVPANGTFVNDKVLLNRKVLNIVLAFPERSISPETLNPEVWALDSEMYRGLLEGAAGNGVKVHFEYFQDEVTDIQLRHQLKQMEQYDAAVFTGRQLLALQKAFAGQHPVFQVSSVGTTIESPIIGVSYDRIDALRQLARHACDCAYRSVGTISISSNQRLLERASLFRDICREQGLVVSDDTAWEFDPDNPETPELLRRKLGGPLPDMIFCNHAEFILDVYEAAADCQVKFGQDAGIAGIATGWTFRGLLPSLTHIKVPQYEIGRNIIAATISSFRQSKPVISLPLIKPQLIQGKSTRLIIQ